MKSKKERMIIIAAVILVALKVIYCGRIASIYVSNSFAISMYGEQYNEILYPTSVVDYITAKKLLSEADKAFSSITSKKQAEEQFGKLSTYCIVSDYYPDAATEEHDIDFVAAEFDRDTGYVWVIYSQAAYTENGKLTYGSEGLSRWKYEKVNGKRTLVSIKEHP